LKIVFITSSLEPGRDGVGDYSRRLAGEIIRQGNPCNVLSLNDAYVSEHSFDYQEMEGASIPVLRLPRLMPLRERMTVARQFVSDFKPDWVSLQYVCYGYHPKGLAWMWNGALSELGGVGRHRHLMLHELWIGPPPLKRWLIGSVQRWGIRDLYLRFMPDLVTTSNSLYQKRLLRQKIVSKVIPLFGNIPIEPRNDQRILSLLDKAGCRMVRRPRGSYVIGVIFGTIHPDFDSIPLINWLLELGSVVSKPVLLSLIGRNGPVAEDFCRHLTNSLPDGLEVVMLGEHASEIISQTLSFADFGINTGSVKHLGKSGTFAAMRDHGLPVVISDGELDASLLNNDGPQVFQFSTMNSVKGVAYNSRVRLCRGGVEGTASDLIRCFEEVDRAGHRKSGKLGA
jgi:hypothetical protein